MARTSSLTAESREAIERTLAMGAPLTVVAASAGVSARTVSRWLSEGRVARRALSVVPADAVPAEIPEEDEEVQAMLIESVFRAAATDWRAATWLLARRCPEKFG